MNWFKSRYTASLEQQIAELKADKARLEAQVDKLTEQIAHAIPPLKSAWDNVGGQKVSDTKELPLPRTVNWLQARGSLESTIHKITEAEPKEKTANGSR